MSTHPCSGGVIYWFRRDLRVDDNPGLCHAIALAQAQRTWLLPVALSTLPTVRSPWGELTRGAHAVAWSAAAHADLDHTLRALGSGLWRCESLEALEALAGQLGASHIVAEAIDAPDEHAQADALRADGRWRCAFVQQSTLFESSQLPFALSDLPLVFTAFRQAIEGAGLRAAAPCPPPSALPPPPMAAQLPALWPLAPAQRDPRSSIAADRHSGHAGALRHWQRYLDQGLALTYLDTRNALSGPDFSSQLSLDLAWGTLSARRAVAMLDAFERQHGRSKSSYWLWFELMWREHFRWLHQRFGRALYRARGLARQPRAVRASHADWQRWCTGQTGQALVDSGMRELAATGFLSNRMRQIVASHWLHDMGGDWRAGAAWFEAQLMDEDVYNNQGNWLYIAGLGTDPRGGRRFDTERQAAQHDPEGSYRQLWGRS